MVQDSGMSCGPEDLVPAAPIRLYELSRGSPELPPLQLLQCLQQSWGCKCLSAVPVVLFLTPRGPVSVPKL